MQMIKESMAKIEKKINSPNENPMINHVNRKVLHGANFQGSPMGFYIDYVRVFVAGMGRLLFTKFTKIMI
jgi:phenylalanine ammonia-lyase